MFRLISSAFEDGAQIPREYSQEGDNISPELEWTGLPEGTQELALICEDPDAPSLKAYVQWVAYGISPKSFDHTEAVEGVNSAGSDGYVGPMPPRGHGWHRYIFKLFALDKKLNLEPGLSADELRDKIRGHVIGEARLTGLYRRPSNPRVENEMRP